MDYKARYEEWLKRVDNDAILKLLKAMQNDERAKENAFYKELEFGTGGLRGEIGAGTNCLNIYTIAKVTQGIADCMKKYGFKTAAISYDSRINSDVFSKKAAEVLAANGMTVYISRELMPTPFLSFLTRNVKADIGVMITASHNPAKYNGYKVYGSDGCQLTDARAEEMIDYINKIDPFTVKTDSFDNYIAAKKIIIASDKIEESYMGEVKKQSLLVNAENLSIVYSPLNGAGYRLVPQILKDTGVKELHVVEEQSYPDGNFTTCSYPNPEKPEALKLALDLAKNKKVDLVIATDPDTDRIGTAVLHNGEYKLLSGNEVGVLLADFLFSVKKLKGTLPKNPVIVKTIVSTSLALKVAEEYGAESYDVLTGFKYIGDVIAKLERKGEQSRFVLGFEESYGYLSGTYVRDKDAIVASMLVAQMASHFKSQGKTLCDRLEEIYSKFGTYEQRLLNFEFPGAEGNAKMKKLLNGLRQNPITDIAGKRIIKTIDYLVQTEFDLPKANVLLYKADDGSQLIVRPSGTEPFIKLYMTACKTREENKVFFESLKEQLNKIFN